MCETCNSCVFFCESRSAIGTCEINDTDVHEAQPACGNYKFWEDRNFKHNYI